MLRLKIPDGIDKPVPVLHGRDLEPGKEYLCSNRFVGQMLLSQYKARVKERRYPIRTLLKVENWTAERPFEILDRDFNDEDIWLNRGGGYGDLLAMTPLIQEILDRWPHCRIHVVCGIQYHDLFHGLDVEYELIPIPFDPNLLICDFEELIEGNPLAEEQHIIELFFDRAGLTNNNKKIFYRVRTEELNEATENFPRNSKPRVGVQLMASAYYRTYPKIVHVIAELAKTCEVLVFGSPGQVEITPHPNVINLMAHKLSFRQSAAVLSTCAVCVAPDSALVHLSAALDIPCVALYGPMPSFLRVSSDKCHGIDGTAPCAPCFFHADHADEFPAGQPCLKVGKCIALDAIPVETVVAEAQRFLKSAR